MAKHKYEDQIALLSDGQKTDQFGTLGYRFDFTSPERVLQDKLQPRLKALGLTMWVRRGSPTNIMIEDDGAVWTMTENFEEDVTEVWMWRLPDFDDMAKTFRFDRRRFHLIFGGVERVA